MRSIFGLFLILPTLLFGQYYEGETEKTIRKNHIYANFSFYPRLIRGKGGTSVQNGGTSIQLAYDRRLGKNSRQDYYVSISYGRFLEESSHKNYGTLTAKWLESEGKIRLEGAGGISYNGNTTFLYGLAGIRYHFNDAFFMRMNFATYEGLGIGLGGSF